VLQIVFFAQKTPDFGKKKYVTDLGGTPPPLYGQNPQSSSSSSNILFK
jgi:hypothetical protein